jgi:hypothetical protein
MANEKIGRVFEALTFLSLERIQMRPSWEKKHPKISIDPDIVLGDFDAPTHWLLLTSTISAKNSLEKFWRNMGELFEVKRVFP